MPVLIEFTSREDRLRAIDVLFEEQETYHCVPKRCFVVSAETARKLTAQGVRYRVLGGERQEEETDEPRA